MDKQINTAAGSVLDALRNSGILKWGRVGFLVVVLGYSSLIVALTIPPVQRALIYANLVAIPLKADYNSPEKYGISPFKTVNVYINSTDGVTLGAWFTFADPYFASKSFNNSDVSGALKSYPTIVYFHGNDGTRAFDSGVSFCSAFSSRLHVNILSFDFRGHADSTGWPTEQGTIQDGIAVFDWLISKGAAPKDIMFVGHSLGAAIAAQSAVRLDQDRGIKLRGVVLMSGFSSVAKHIETFKMFGIPIPFLGPVRLIPGAWSLLLKTVYTRYSTIDCLPSIRSPIMLVHSKCDQEIGSFHSVLQFNKLLESYLPPAPPALESLPQSISREEYETIQEQHKEYTRIKEELLHISYIKGDSFARHQLNSKERTGEVRAVFLETQWGGHERIALQGGVQDVMKELFRLGERL